MNPKLLEVASLEAYLKPFSEEAKAWVTHPYVSKEEPIVLGGCGRSGTSLLRVMLDSHSSISCGPESFLFIPLLPTEKHPDPFEDLSVPKHLSWLYSTNENVTINMWKQASCQAGFTDTFLSSLAYIMTKRWADKTPKNVQVLPYIFKHWPMAKFVHVIRDGRDVACSLRHHPKWRFENSQRIAINRDNPISNCVDRWVNDVSMGLAYRGHPNYYEVKYEDLILYTEKTLKKLLNWVGEPWDAKVLTYYEVERDPAKDPQAWGTKNLFSKTQ